MIKQLGIYLLSFLFLAIFGYYSHTVIFSGLAIKSIIPLAKVYIYFSSFSLLLCVTLLLLFKTKKFKDQIGFFYLAGVALKIIIFCFVFYEQLFIQITFTNQEVINFLIPMILMLVLEVFFIKNLLNNSGYLKNVK